MGIDSHGDGLSQWDRLLGGKALGGDGLLKTGLHMRSQFLHGDGLLFKVGI